MPPSDDGILRHPLSWRGPTFRATAALLLLMLLLRLLWGWQTHRALSTQLADLRRQGQPTSVSDIPIESIPDAQNPFHYQLLAAKSLAPGIDSPANSILDYKNYPPFPPDWWKLAETSERANTQAFALARQARQHSRVQIHQRLTSPLINVLLPYLSDARELGNALADGALYVHLKGSDPEALDRVADVLHLARTLRHDDFVVSQQVAIAIDNAALDHLQTIAPGLQLRPPSPTAAATRARVERLIPQLLDEDPIWRHRTASLEFEQLVIIDWAEWSSGPNWFIRPLADREALRNVRNLQIAIRASRLRTRPQVTAALATDHPDRADGSPSLASSFVPNPLLIPRYSRWFHLGTPNYSRLIDTTFRDIAERRATAVSLAAQLYRADHNGAWPAHLQDLVPAYLPAVPSDPYHDDNRPLGYTLAKLPDGTPRPLLSYDAGDPDNALLSPAPMYGWQPNTKSGRRDGNARQYRDLSRFTPPPPPSTKAVDGDQY